MHFPANCKYTEDHEWIRIEDGRTASVGITDFAQSELGELVYIEVETVGESLDAHAVFGAVEAVKTTSDLLLPVSGKILEFNPDLMYDDLGHWMYCTEVMRGILDSIGVSSKNLFWCPPDPAQEMPKLSLVGGTV